MAVSEQSLSSQPLFNFHNRGYALNHHPYFRDSLHDETLETSLDFDLDSGGRRLVCETNVILLIAPKMSWHTSSEVVLLVTEFSRHRVRLQHQHIAASVWP